MQVYSEQNVCIGLLLDGANNSKTKYEIQCHVKQQICNHCYNATSEQGRNLCIQGPIMISSPI